MSDAGTIKVNEAFLRARQQLAEEAKKPRAYAATYAEVKEFVSKARTEVVPGIEYHKESDSTLIVLQNRDSKKLYIDAGLIAGMVDAAKQDTQNYAVKTVLANTQTALSGYAESIEKARAGRPQSEPLGRGLLYRVA